VTKAEMEIGIKKSARAMVGLVIIELLLLGGTAWMVAQTTSGAWHASNPAKTISMITSTGGVAMGVVGVILLIAFFRHRKKGN
jgi:NADH:ubiquinone oxidoreductase subunit K